VSRRISLAARGEVVHPVPGRCASVVVPLIAHPEFGPALVVSERSLVNGHNGRPMSNAGEVVLFGGSIEPGETPDEAALRELAEESGTGHLLADRDYRIVTELGRWTTESGFAVTGFLGRVPHAFAAEAVPEAREVARIAYLPLPAVYAAPVVDEYHLVRQTDRTLTLPGEVLFESPTLRVDAANHDGEWVLWGLAGFMVQRLRERFVDADALRALA